MNNIFEAAKELSGVYCECGIQMNRLEYEEYGKCLFCVKEEEDRTEH
mgnify:FL=1